MNDPERLDPPGFRLGRWIGLSFLVVVLGFVLLCLAAAVLYFPPIPQSAGALLFGWWSFLVRTVPAIHGNYDLFAMAAVCAVILLAGSHWALRWMARAIASKREFTWTWPWRWTWCGLSGLALLFLIGMSVGGIVHQLGWLFSSPEPFAVEARTYLGSYQVHELENALAEAWSKSNAVPAAFRAHAHDPNNEYFLSRVAGRDHRREELLEVFEVLLILDPGERVSGYLFFPRDPQRRARFGGWSVVGEERKQLSWNELAAQIEQLRPSLVAL